MDSEVTSQRVRLRFHRRVRRGVLGSLPADGRLSPVLWVLLVLLLAGIAGGVETTGMVP